MPDPDVIKQIIDSGAYAVGNGALGTVLCVNGTVPAMLARGLSPEPHLAQKYIRAAKLAEKAADDLKDAGMSMVAELAARALSLPADGGSGLSGTSDPQGGAA